MRIISLQRFLLLRENRSLKLTAKFISISYCTLVQLGERKALLLFPNESHDFQFSLPECKKRSFPFQFRPFPDADQISPREETSSRVLVPNSPIPYLQKTRPPDQPSLSPLTPLPGDLRASLPLVSRKEGGASSFQRASERVEEKKRETLFCPDDVKGNRFSLGEERERALFPRVETSIWNV